MCFLEDVQDFLVIARLITNFLYRLCISLDNQLFQEVIVETITDILFTAHNGAIFDIVHALFKAQHLDVCDELFHNINAG